MTTSLDDLASFAAVARAASFRDAARKTQSSASRLSETVRRLESSLGVRLLNRTTRSVTLTEAGARLLERLGPALEEAQAALDVVNGFRDSPGGTLRLNVPLSAARLVLPSVIAPFLRAHPGIQLDLTAEEGFIDIVAAGADAGIRYEERLDQDMIAVPIGPRVQYFAAAASPEYLALHGAPEHPRDLLNHQCLRGRFASGSMPDWEFERDGETLYVDPTGPMVVSMTASDVAVDAAIKGLGVIFLFQDWLQPAMDRGELVPVLKPWWTSFSGPFLYYPSRRYMTAPLRAFVDYIKQLETQD
ncbi:MAG: LysR family transcriptional regulator [Stenotrophomonas acidaminiphila]|nr:MAG: LysR family transcriptional regulator [Stenotrophomonas acidaminiphila]